MSICTKCNRSSETGWVIVLGRCKEHDTGQRRARRRTLKAQAMKIDDPAPPRSLTAASGVLCRETGRSSDGERVSGGAL